MMRTAFRKSLPFLGASFSVAIALLLFAESANAAGLKEAQVTQIVKEVQLLPGQAASRPAVIRDSVRQGMAVRTGTESRTELTFTDQTLARLGANTIFSFSDGARKVDLGGGAMLLSVPEGGATATVRTAAVTAAVTGGTALLEHHKNAYAKLINLEGILRVSLTKHPDQKTSLRPGQMLIVKVDATSLPEPVDVDLEKLVRSCLLITDFPPLANEALIAEAIRYQQQQVAQGTLVPTEVVYNDDGTIMTLVDPTSLDLISLVAIGPAGPAAPLFLIVTYTGAAGGSWSKPASWNPAVVPNNTAGTLFNAIINGGTIFQDIVTGVIIQQLQMSGGTLQLDNPLSLNTGLLFTGGSIFGGNLFIAGASTQSATMTVQNVTLNNSGTYDITFQSGSALTAVGSNFINSGTLRKTNGIDEVTFDIPINNSGTISVLNGAFTFAGGGTNSGILSPAAGTVIQFASNFSMLSGTRFLGPGIIRFANGTVTTMSGTINNLGTLSFNSAGSLTDLVLNGNVDLTGGGVINLTNADRILGAGVLTTDNTIQGDTAGGGSIGANQIGIVLQSGGVIDANTNGSALGVDPNPANGFVNQGTLRASNGGLLVLNGNGGGGFANSGGLITALNASQVQLTNGVTITGGTLSTFGSGLIRNLNSASLSSLTNAGAFAADDNTTTTLTGTINNTGSISLNSTANFTDLVLNGNVTLTGGGQLNLANAARVLGNGILTNVNNTIHGNTLAGGSLGANQIGIVNQVGGVIDADGGGILDVDPDAVNGLVNQGTMRASNGGILRLNGNGGGGFNNTGTIETVAGGTLQFNGGVTSSGLVDVDGGALTVAGSYSQTAGTFRLAGGSVNSASILSFLGGLVDARGTITGSINNSATFRPALGGSGLNVNGNVTLLNGSNLSFQLGGLTQGSQYSFLNVNGTVGLAGNLVLSFANGFQNSVTGADTFTILSSTAALSGTFANIASGDRLATSDLFGSFLVTYSGNDIVLSDFQLGLPITAAIWTGTTGNWSDPTKWSSNPNFPNNGQPAPGSVYDATLDNGGIITLDIPIVIENFTLSNGTVTGTNNLTINQLFTWNNGTLSGSGVTNANGGIVFGDTTLNLNQRTLNLAAGQTAAMSGANTRLQFLGGAIFNNSGTFFAQNNRDIVFGAGAGTFNNIGTFTRDTAAGTFLVDTVVFHNTGVVNVQTGTLNLAGGDGGSTTGSFNVAAGATLQIGSDFNFAAASSLAGAGSVNFSNGTQQINGTFTVPAVTISGGSGTAFNVAVSLSTLDLTGGTLTGSGAVTVTGPFNWTGGAMAGSGVTNANGGIVFGDTTLNFSQRTLNLAAGQTAAMSGANTRLQFLGGAIFNNSGTFFAQNNQDFVFGFGGGTFNNIGTFTRDTAAGTFSVGNGVEFSNTGTLNVNSGTLALNSTTTSSGPINVNGATLSLGGTFTQTADSINLFAGTLSIGGTAAAHLITGTGGTINVTGTLSSANGLDFRGVNVLGTSGGTLTFTAPSITFAAAGINGALFTGGDAAPGSGVAGGNGGNLTVTATTGDIVVDADIDASTGANDAVPNGGNGGTVNLTANQGTVTVNNRIQVSDRTAGKQSAAGGNINIVSNRPTGVAIQIGNSAQLLSLLDAVAPGPGGKITLLATGASSQINVSGNFAADHSSATASAVDIRHTGVGGRVTLTNANISADIVKIAALGNNGVLTIGGGILSANDTLRLYADGSNGQIVFAGNCTISGGNFAIIAAPTVTVNNLVTVTVTGAQAQIFADTRNYTGSGGNGPNSGTFTNATSLPFGGQPALGPPGGP